MEGNYLDALRDQLGSVMFGTAFLFFGMITLLAAVARRGKQIRILVWFGIWSSLYGSRLLADTAIVRGALPDSIHALVNSASGSMGYLMLVFALLAWSELTRFKLKQFTQITAELSLVVAAAGIASLAIHYSDFLPRVCNSLLAVCALPVLTTVVTFPKLSRRWLVFSSRALAVGTLLFALEALGRNVTRMLNVHLPGSSLLWADHLAFGGFLLCFAYVAGRKLFASERRLISIDSELQVARQIQASILPAGTPELDGICVAVSYRPMMAVGGDFYDFVVCDPHRAGFLVADVAGHGVPAALIAAMIKIAVQSVAPFAHDPGRVLNSLNRVLYRQLRGYLVSAAYLWIDLEAGEASYSAAGHPPLIHQRNGNPKRIESNGLLFGVVPNPEYPVQRIRLQPGDRFLLYTDGLTEAENGVGESFGERRLDDLIGGASATRPSELAAELVSELQDWRPSEADQQDDISLLIIDVIGAPITRAPLSMATT